MMTEVGSDHPEIVATDTDVATQLQDAAQTDVTISNGSPLKGTQSPMFTQQAGITSPAPSGSRNQSVSPPQVNSNVTPSQQPYPLGSPSQPPNPYSTPTQPPNPYSTPTQPPLYPGATNTTPQMYTPFASPLPYQSPQGVSSMGGIVNQIPVASPSPYASGMAPGTMQTPYEASAAIQMDDVAVSGGGAAPHVGEDSGFFGWGRGFMNKVVERTKSSVETMITTLDPQMREVIYSGGDISVLVTSSKETKVGPVRDAFLSSFGRATVQGRDCEANTAPQPVGFTAGCKGAEDRIQHLRASGLGGEQEVIVSIEGFIVEILPERWYEMSCLLLHDPTNNIEVQTFSQPTPLPPHVIAYMQDSTPPDYPLRWSGLAVTVGDAVERVIPNTDRRSWQQSLVGVSRQETLTLAARSLVGLYRNRLSPNIYANT